MKQPIEWCILVSSLKCFIRMTLRTFAGRQRYTLDQYSPYIDIIEVLPMFSCIWMSVRIRFRS